MSAVVQLGFNRLCGALTTPHPIFVSGDSLQVCPLPFQKLLFTLLGDQCSPCRRVPEANFCRRLPDVDQTFAGD